MKETDSTNNTNNSESVAPDAEEARAQAEESRPTVEQMEAQIAEAQDRTLRAQAELANVRKRLRREMEEERRYYSMPLVSDLLSVLDNLHRAIEAAEQADATTEGLLAGVRMVADQLEQTLQKHHCVPIEAHGLPFDPNVHEAIGEHPHDELPPGTVAHVAQRGFKLHERVVRPSQVLVARQKPSSDDEPPSAEQDADQEA